MVAQHPEKSNAGSAELPERAPSPVSRTIRIALDFVILHLQALSCCTRDENKPYFFGPYFSARGANFAHVTECLFHKPGSAALLVMSSLNASDTTGKDNLRNGRCIPSHGAEPKRAAACRPGRHLTEAALGSDKSRSQPRFCTHAGSGRSAQPGAQLARPLVRHYAGRRGRKVTLPAPPLRAAGSGLTGITDRVSCWRAWTSSDGWQDFGCWLERRLKSDTDDPQ